MQLGSIYISNFLSIKEVKVDFPSGIISVIGQNKDVAGSNSNGSGKSALFDAISWVLFGQTLRPIDKDSVIRRGAEAAEVELIFNNGDDRYLINRKRGKENALSFYSEQNDMTGSTLSITQDKINAVLGMDYKTFLAVATFDLDIMRFARATDKEQKEILERILNLEIYGKALEKVRKEIADKERALELVNENKKFLNQQLHDTRLEQSNVIQEKTLHVQSIVERKVETENTIRLLMDQNAQKDALTADLKAKLDIVKSQMNIPLKNNPFTTEVYTAERNANNAKYKITQTKNQIATLEKNIEEAESRVGKPCGECGRAIETAQVENVIESNAEKALKLEDELNAWEKELEGYNNVLQSAQKQSKEFEEGQVANNRIRTQASLDFASGNSLILRYQSEQKENEKKIIRLESSLREFESQADTFDARIKRLEEKISSIASQIEEKDKSVAIIVDNMAILKYWEKGFGYAGIRSVLLDDVCATITTKSNEYLNHLMGGTLWIECSTQSMLKSGDRKERFEIKTFNQYGAGTYFGNSKGEQQRIDIALALALQNIAKNRNKNPLGFAIFDEVFERLDENGCDMLISLLHKERNNLGTIFVVTNNPNFSTRFGKTIEFIKQNGVTQCINTKPASNLTPKVSPSLPSPLTMPVVETKSPKIGKAKRKVTS